MPKADHNQKTLTPISRILNRSGDAGDGKGDNDLANPPSGSGEIRAHDPAPSGAPSSTNPTTNRAAAAELVDTAASLLRNALTITSFGVAHESGLLAAAVHEVDALMRQALQLIERGPATLPNPELAQIPLYRPDPVTPPKAYLAEQLQQMDKTNRELAGDPFTLLDDGPAGSGA